MILFLSLSLISIKTNKMLVDRQERNWSIAEDIGLTWLRDVDDEIIKCNRSR